MHKNHHRAGELYGSGLETFGGRSDKTDAATGEWPMANYRFYVLDKDDYVREPPRVFECPDDEAAVENAVQFLNGQVLEVWDHDRRVVRLEPISAGYRPEGLRHAIVRVRFRRPSSAFCRTL
jgi:hypothetical protein